MYPSFLSYLDHLLPSKLRINIRNFFSKFIFFVKPYDDNIYKLRDAITAAKKQKNDFYYLTHFEHVKNTLPQLSVNKVKFIYSEMEINYLERIKQSASKENNIETNSNDYDTHDIPHDTDISMYDKNETQTVIPSEKSSSRDDEVKLKPNSKYSSTHLVSSAINTKSLVSNAINTESCLISLPEFMVYFENNIKQYFPQNKLEEIDSHIESLIKDKSKLQLIELVKAFYLDKMALRNHNLHVCIVKIINHLALKDIATTLFSDSKQNINFADYFQYLKTKADSEVKELVHSMGSLGDVVDDHGVELKSGREYRRFTFPLRSMRQGDYSLFDNPKTVGNFANSFNSWVDTSEENFKHASKALNPVIQKIKSVLESLLNTINIFTQSRGLKDQNINEKIAHEKEVRLDYDRTNFNKKLREGKLGVVSRQTLQELFPNIVEEKVEQCKKLGCRIT